MANLNIDNLKATISNKQGVALPTMYKVVFPSIGSVSSEELNLLCSSVNLPGRQMMTQPKKIGMIEQKIGYDQAYDDVSFTFRLLNDYGVRKYFEAWQNMVVDQDTLELGYVFDYGKTIQIQQLKKGWGLPIYNKAFPVPKLPAEIQNRLPKIGPFDFAQGEFDLDFITSDQVVYEVTLEQAFPTTLNAIELNDATTDATVELTVQLSYRKWRSEFPGTSDSILKRVAGTLLSRIGSRI